MKVTEYFKVVQLRPDRAEIKAEWIESTIKNALRREVQADGRIRCWSKVEEKGKYWRVVLLADGETVHNAFFDRGFRE
jgi:cation diffusion facilitator CzcD-associated flavoprotein CzcO